MPDIDNEKDDALTEEESLRITRRKLVELRSDASFLRLAANDKRRSIWEIANISRLETSHSAFLAWLFNPEESHGLGYFALKRLMQVVDYAITLDVNNRWLAEKKWVPDDIMGVLERLRFYDVKVQTERFLDGVQIDGKRGRFDIEIIGHVGVKDEDAQRQLPFRIVIENKVKSHENDGQTNRYFEWLRQYRAEDEITIMLFLTPRGSCDFCRAGAQPLCQNAGFLEINYQLIMDCIIDPALISCAHAGTREILSDYVRALSSPNFENDQNGEILMAMSQEERKLLLDFFEENKSLILKMCRALSEDGEDGEHLVETINQAMADGNDRTKYTVQKGAERTTGLGKGRAVLKVMQLFVNEHTEQTVIDGLRSERYQLSGTRKLLSTLEELDARVAESANPNRERNRAFRNEAIVGPNNTRYYVHTQWGIGNFPTFLERFRADFPDSGITITPEQ